MSLRHIIAQRIRRSGPLRFSEYMELSLYHPEHGYYSTGAARTGRAGDFFTSVSVGPVFGELMGTEFCAVWESLGHPAHFTLVEQGANDGRFAADVLTWARREHPDFFTALRIRLREPFSAVRAVQQNTLRDFPSQVSWSDEPVAHGVFFANELLDALPVDRWVLRNGSWCELRVASTPQSDSTSSAYCETEHPPASPLPPELQSLDPSEFPEGYITETSPHLVSCIRSAAHSITSGALYFADYGFPSEELRAPHRSAGSLRGYRAHRREDDPFAAPGETDLTTHVDWTAVQQALAASGAAIRELTDQGRFLTRLAAPALLRMESATSAASAAGDPAASARWLRQFRTLTHPGHLGRVFQILAAVKTPEHSRRIGSARPD